MEHPASPEMVDHPTHYQTEAGIEAIDVIEQYALGFHLGNAMKYLLRAGRKNEDAATDLRKAVWYLVRWMDGIDSRHGVEYPSADHGDYGGSEWRTPEDIVAAFELTGSRGQAVLHILGVAADDDDRPDASIRSALMCVESELEASP